mgnify:CR=1 FL=1
MNFSENLFLTIFLILNKFRKKLNANNIISIEIPEFSKRVISVSELIKKVAKINKIFKYLLII